MHSFIYGMFLGLGTSMPIGPVNLEIARRTLQKGFKFGILTGFGAVFADITFLTLLSIGSLSLMTKPVITYWMNVGGSLIIGYFGLQAFLAKNLEIDQREMELNSFVEVFFGGLGMTLLNPLSILFWFSVSSQIAGLEKSSSHALLYAGCGVLLGTSLWMISYNSLLHFSKKIMNKNFLSLFNKLSGAILMCYAIHGLLLARH